MRPSFFPRLAQWFQRLPGGLPGLSGSFSGVLETRLQAGDSLSTALEHALPRLGTEAVRVAIRAEDGPIALVLVDLLRALKTGLDAAEADLRAAGQPGCLWAAERVARLATALGDDVVRLHLVNAVLGVAGVTSELSLIEVRRLDAKTLEAAVVTVLLRMRTTVLTRSELQKTASTFHRGTDPLARLADA
jgi:hypothetical protein